MNSIDVTVFSAKPYDQEFLSRVVNSQIKFHCYNLALNPISAAMAQNATVVSAFVNDDLSKDTLEVLARGDTKLIALRCAGYNRVDLKAAKNLGITIVNVPAYSPYAVAEHTLALMLALSRKLPRAYNRVRDNNFSLDGLLGFDFYRKTVGIIGGGKIGQLVGERLRAFGCEVLVYDPYSVEVCTSMGFKMVDLNELFSRSDIITLHCPLLESTRYIINADAINKMKQGVMLINTSRGQLLDTKAVLAALKLHKIAYFGMDVYELEDTLFFEDHSSEIIQDDVFQRLITLPNVIVTGHQAYFTKEALSHIAETTVSNILDFVAGRPLLNQVQ
ncbi:MAG: 2-hydroxyacid dehydrogenase [Methyloprofundus sp.]|nr:2-hydroxyacid dehydrogenase [Methyloprofundus sp.]